MTLDDWQRRDAEIARLEALGAHRTAAEQDELVRLEICRDKKWQNIARAVLRTRRKLAELEAYARQHRLPIEGTPA